MDALRTLLVRARRIAVVGFSPRTHRPSYRIAAGLQKVGYHVIPVRPGISEGLGEKAYPTIASLDDVPDIVNVFRSAEYVEPIVEDCIRLGAKTLWLQDDIVNEQAAQRAAQAGITVVMDRCILRDYYSLCA
ncbi:MAG TPA: CoA-binding protein [Burkholderiales bacterium]|nr:CoA-binding protein [Burkholderiales bacterium]